jgi:hypothetical protein
VIDPFLLGPLLSLLSFSPPCISVFVLVSSFVLGPHTPLCLTTTDPQHPQN